MKLKLKIWHLLVTFCIILIIVRFITITKIFALQFSYTTVLFTDYSNAINHLDFELIDYFVSGILVIALPLIIFFRFKDRKFLQSKLDFSSFVIGILFLIFIFSPLISQSHPDFQKDIGLTKLLPPFSKAIFLRFERKVIEKPSGIDKFVEIKNSVLKSVAFSIKSLNIKLKHISSITFRFKFIYNTSLM